MDGESRRSNLIGGQKSNATLPLNRRKMMQLWSNQGEALVYLVHGAGWNRKRSVYFYHYVQSIHDLVVVLVV